MKNKKAPVVPASCIMHVVSNRPSHTVDCDHALEKAVRFGKGHLMMYPFREAVHLEHSL
jgi:hypothetical protein